jgi:hypothetical protein
MYCLHLQRSCLPGRLRDGRSEILAAQLALKFSEKFHRVDWYLVTDVLKERIAFNFSIKQSDCLTNRLPVASQKVSDCTIFPNPEAHTFSILSRATLNTCIMEVQKIALWEDHFPSRENGKSLWRKLSNWSFIIYIVFKPWYECSKGRGKNGWFKWR